MDIITVQNKLEERSKETARKHLESLKAKLIKDINVYSVPIASLDQLAKGITSSSSLAVSIQWIIGQLITAITPETIINQINADLQNFINKVNTAQEQVDEIQSQLQ